jgi:hypothetical protein
MSRRSLSKSFESAENKMKTQKIMTRNLDTRFGVAAVKKGYTTKHQILRALEIQLDEDFSIGYHRFIGQILVDGGLITPAQRDEVLDTLLMSCIKDNTKESP